MVFDLHRLFICILIFWTEFRCILSKNKIDVDPNGYILYCPCMGRFGNQAEQFIGSLSFAQNLNRTLVLPAWIVYPEDRPFQSLQIPFHDWFKVEPLKAYYKKVLTMEHFMDKLAPTVWPVGERKGFCYKFRNGENGCAMKEGNPFGPFWDNYHVNFDGYVEHTGLLWHSHHEPTRNDWWMRFPGYDYPVMAFQGAPGDFPSLKINQHIHKYLEFSDRILAKAQKYIKKEFGGKKYVAIHLRNGIDITRVCDELDKYPSLFASKQCTDHTKDQVLTYQMCNPSKQEIIKKVKKYIRQVQATALFVATDNDAMVDVFNKELKRMKVSVHHRSTTNNVEDPITDIAIMSTSDFFIGNCVSTFSAFVRRQRESRNLPLGFFGIEYPQKIKHTEL